MKELILSWVKGYPEGGSVIKANLAQSLMCALLDTRCPVLPQVLQKVPWTFQLQNCDVNKPLLFINYPICGI